MKRWIIILFSLISGVSYARLGGSGAVFLENGCGARPLAMGGAYASFAQGIEAVYWNPAGLTTLSSACINFTHANLFAGIMEENIGFAVPIANGAIGVSAIGLFSGNMEVTTEEQRYQGGTGEKFSYNDIAVGISYARRLTEKFSAGVTVKGIGEFTRRVSSTGVGLDFGAIYNTKIRDLRFGFVIQNFGPDMAFRGEELDTLMAKDTLQDEDVPARWKSESYSMPITFQGGFAIDVIKTPETRLTLVCEITHPIDQPATDAIGIEYAKNEGFFLRMGHTLKNNRGFSLVDVPDPLPQIIPNAYGAGIKTSVGGRPFLLDYTLEQHEYLGLIHRLSLGISL